LQCTSDVVEGKLLPKIDDNIDSALGLAVLYQYLRTAALNQQQQTQQSGLFTMKLFVHYFTIKHLLVATCHLVPKTHEEQNVQRVKYHLHRELKLFFTTISSSAHLFTSDLMLCKLSNNSYLHSTDTNGFTTWMSSSGNCDRRQLVSLITHFSLQQLLTYRHLTLPPTTESTGVSDITDFMALYLYRCQLYERCEQLCRQGIHDQIDFNSCSIPRVSTMYHEFVQLMDDDVASVIGLIALTDTSRVQSWFSKPLTITQLTLSLYLLTKCQTKPRPDRLTDACVAETLSSLTVTLDWIAVAQKTIPTDDCVDHFILKLAERQAIIHITEQLAGRNTHKECDQYIRIHFEFGTDGISVVGSYSLEREITSPFKEIRTSAWHRTEIELARLRLI